MGDTGAQWQAAQLDGLLREMRRQASSGAEPDVQRVLCWLCRQTGVDIALVDASGMVESSTAGFPGDRVLGPLAVLLGQLSGGGTAAATTWVDDLYVHCEALGAPLVQDSANLNAIPAALWRFSVPVPRALPLKQARVGRTAVQQ